MFRPSMTSLGSCPISFGMIRMVNKSFTVGWDKCSKPYEEGGLGIRSFNDISRAFGAKLRLRFWEQNSLWATYISLKYTNNTHPNDAYMPQKSSSVWHRMLKYKDTTKSYIKRLVGHGDFKIYEENWLDASFMKLNISKKVKELFIDNLPNENLIKETLGDDAWQEIEDKHI